MNKINKDTPFIILGLIGVLVTLYGFVELNYSIQYFAIGCLFLLTTALYYKLTYFIALELILLSGYCTIFLRIGPILQLILPILLCMQLAVYYLLSGQLKSILRLTGVVAIPILSIGYSYDNQWLLLLGSIGVAIFAFSSAYQGRKIALLWGGLNTFYVIYMTIHLLYQ